ncbi:MAG: hypothetical protein A2428_16195 [Bdellovibrionales bacterium RIFOXYC1_FULL_54_43]|nr:MAG: hypothetical protein A2428_16195 [Bdellovibrionales bacterium RIFOXYC1_FULL_54_43]OFZ78707.1 MAG: hypothetical protein A2603_02025 [Bdellovibrionales bacterium RIFOXYD1_FULL_55_31]
MRSLKPGSVALILLSISTIAFAVEVQKKESEPAQTQAQVQDTNRNPAQTVEKKSVKPAEEESDFASRAERFMMRKH